MTSGWRSGSIVVLTLLMTSVLFSCPVCFGEKNSQMAAGMNTAVIVMLGITGTVLSFIGVFFLVMWRRYQRRQRQLSQQVFINENGVLQSQNEKGVVEWNNF